MLKDVAFARRCTADLQGQPLYLTGVNLLLAFFFWLCFWRRGDCCFTAQVREIGIGPLYLGQPHRLHSQRRAARPSGPAGAGLCGRPRGRNAPPLNSVLATIRAEAASWMT